MWNGVYVWVKPLDYSSLETNWETTLFGCKVELEWRLKVHVINHEWNRSMFIASAVCFVWDTKPDLPTVMWQKILRYFGSSSTKLLNENDPILPQCKAYQNHLAASSSLALRLYSCFSLESYWIPSSLLLFKCFQWRRVPRGFKPASKYCAIHSSPTT